MEKTLGFSGSWQKGKVKIGNTAHIKYAVATVTGTCLRTVYYPVLFFFLERLYVG